MAGKITIAVLFGGRSGEHEISLRSAASILSALHPEKYQVVPIAIRPDGHWVTLPPEKLPLEVGAVPPPVEMVHQAEVAVLLSADPTMGGLHFPGGKGEEGGWTQQKIDLVFPILHGTYGEDGTLQGLLELADLPYVGCGPLAAATGMDKVVMKRLFEQAGLPVVPYRAVFRHHWESDQAGVEQSLIDALGLPCFVKPANLGSSVGISRATDSGSLREALTLAARYDRKMIVEQAVKAREIEVSVLGNETPRVSLPGEIVPPAVSFYDYRAKYIDANGARLLIPVDLPPALTASLQDLAQRAFEAIDGAGLARVDFFLEPETEQIYVNEINTMPGFTSISMYPKLWEASGLSYRDLIDQLIDLALSRHRDKHRTSTHYSGQ
ncbi:MAG: D-alanine--D-alanine ligase family protein [Blastocatellia bacterium]